MEPYYDDGRVQIWHGDWRDVVPRLNLSDIGLLLTDPPYGDDFDTDFTRFTGGVAAERSRHPAVLGDDAEFEPSPFLGLAPHIVLFGANRYSNRLPCGSWLVWDKRSPNGHKNVMSDAEVAWWNHGRGVYLFQHTWDGFNRASERQTAYHPNQKPVALMAWCIHRTRSEGTILDPFMGSGPVAAAAQRLGRHYIGIELREQYCRRAVERLSQLALPLACD